MSINAFGICFKIQKIKQIIAQIASAMLVEVMRFILWKRQASGNMRKKKCWANKGKERKSAYSSSSLLHLTCFTLWGACLRNLNHPPVKTEKRWQSWIPQQNVLDDETNQPTDSTQTHTASSQDLFWVFCVCVFWCLQFKYELTAKGHQLFKEIL